MIEAAGGTNVSADADPERHFTYVDAERISFVWNSERHGLSREQVGSLFAVNSDIHTKFQVKLFKKGFFELDAKIESLEDRADGTVKVSASYNEINESDRTALTQFASDMAYLKSQLRDATEG